MTAPMPMREKIARVLCVATGHDPDQLLTASNGPEWDGKLFWNAFLREADAAIEALMEPTERMITSAENKTNLDHGNLVTAVWQEMIRAAKDGA